MDHEHIVERIIHRLVRKHIAGTTMDSALDSAKAFAERHITPNITFLSSNAVEKSKAKYITTTYSELVRRIGRSGVKASVQVSIEQIGAGIDEKVAIDNLRTIAEAGKSYGVFVWVETDGIGKAAVSSIAKMGGVGPVIQESLADGYAGADRFDAAKVIFRDYAPAAKNATMRRVESLKKSFHVLAVSGLPDRNLSEIIRGRAKNVLIEFGLGDSDRKMNYALKKGANVGVLVPFGKDWIKYAMSSAPEGYMRFVAGKLLKEGIDGGAETA